jgi:hypothetical protein
VSKIDAYFFLVFGASFGWSCLMSISLVDNDDQFFCWLFVLGRIFALRGCPALVGFDTSTESLILAQDERWRRA